ncbi:MAG: hypothetical protein NTU51_09825 [Bacteroidetes bacterium]|nr:hypothetical protein [Bacteroidota bacterium]
MDLKRFFFICFIIIPFWGLAQCDYFKIYHVSGQVFTKENNASVKATKDHIFRAGSIVLGKASQLIMIDPQGHVIVKDQPGEYSFKQVQKQCLTPGSGFTTEYLKFVYEGLTEKEEPEKQKVHASVSRGITLMQSPPDSSVILANTMLFRWSKGSLSSAYILSIRNSKREIVLWKNIRNDTSCAFLQIDTIFKHSGFYSWSLRDNPNQQETSFTLQFPDKEWMKTYTSEKEKLEKELHFSPEINALIMVGFYKKYHLFLEAADLLRKAMRDYPHDKEIQTLKLTD